MSHSKERLEKNCLNCNAEVSGRYCHVCGQENIEPKETFTGLITHFFNDITHFDGKFFSTLRYLISRPGFLPQEFLAGRRARYLHPIKMYVFTSALFFIIFFSMFNARDFDIGDSDRNGSKVDTLQQFNDARIMALSRAENTDDSASVNKAFELIRENTNLAIPDSVKPKKKKNTYFTLGNWEHGTKAEYDSSQLARPPNERDGWLKRKMVYRDLQLKEKYGDDSGQLLKDILDKFFHTFPYLLFVSLPLYALFLKLLYIRKKQFYFVDHAIWLVYLYIFTFITLLILFGLTKLNEVTDWGWIWVLISALLLFGLIYTLRAMRKFYQQRWGRTVFKFVLFNILAFFSINLLFVLFFVITVFQV